ncbi:hypothetical protein Dimus_035774 [Dionaea muscipula]
MKMSTSGKGIEAEPENKKSSAPGATKELDIPDTELPRPELVSTSGRRNIVPMKDTSTPESNLPEQVIHSVPDLARAERQPPWSQGEHYYSQLFKFQAYLPHPNKTTEKQGKLGGFRFAEMNFEPLQILLANGENRIYLLQKNAT